MSHVEQTNTFELGTGSAFPLSDVTTSASMVDTDDNSVSEGEQAVAIAIACVFIVMVVAKVAHSIYVTRRRQIHQVGEAVVEPTVTVVNVTDGASEPVATREVGCQTDAVDGVTEPKDSGEGNEVSESPPVATRTTNV